MSHENALKNIEDKILIIILLCEQSFYFLLVYYITKL